MFDCILVPTDGSEAVDRALEYAVSLARTHDATIRVLYVVNVASYGGLPMETAWEGISDALRDDGRAAIAHVESVVPDDIELETAILEGVPSRVIVEEATPDTCQLVVMGTHGRGGIDRLLLGSVTERVVRNAAVPVLTVNLASETTDSPAETQAAVE